MIELNSIADVTALIGASRTSIKTAAHVHRIGHFCNGKIAGFTDEEAYKLREVIRNKCGNPNFGKSPKPKLVGSSEPPQAKSIQIKQYVRSDEVAIATLKRANGVCELCQKPAPFNRTKTGQPYLEVHHVVPLAHGGLDRTDNTKALCPNCHRKYHHGNVQAVAS